MALTRLQEDLLHDFNEQKAIIEQQLAVFDPLGTELSKPAAQRLVSKGALISAEILCYTLALGSLVFAVLLAKIPPFTILPRLRFGQEYIKLGWKDVEMFNAAIYGFIGIIIILFVLLGRCMRSIRLKNDILHFAGKNIKTLVSQHLQRRVAIQVIHQRHFNELPQTHTEGIVIVDRVRVNDVVNPGYEE